MRAALDCLLSPSGALDALGSPPRGLHPTQSWASVREASTRRRVVSVYAVIQDLSTSGWVKYVDPFEGGIKQYKVWESGYPIWDNTNWTSPWPNNGCSLLAWPYCC